MRPLSFGGLALANSTATTLEMLLLLWLLQRRLGGVNGRSLGLTALRAAAAAAVMLGVLFLWVQWSPSLLPGSAADDWLTAIGGILLGLAVYSLAALALGSEELALVWETVRRRARR